MCWVKTADKIHFTNEFAREKRQDIVEKPKNRFTQEDVDNGVRKLQLEHDKIGKSTLVEGNVRIAQGMARNSLNKGSAMAGHAMELGDVNELDATSDEDVHEEAKGDGQDPDEFDEDDEEEEDKLEDDDGDAMAEDAKLLKQEQKIARSCRAAIRSTSLDLQNFEKNIKSQLSGHPVVVRWCRWSYISVVFWVETCHAYNRNVLEQSSLQPTTLIDK